MGTKTNDETIKYKMVLSINIQGVTSESDIVGAIFGQTEGLLDSDMDLKQLQKSGRMGRIGLELNNRGGATSGKIIIPSSLNKIETAIIAATIESVDRVGPCNCTLKLDKIVDVRKDKRDQITKRASEIMKKWDVEIREEVKDIPTIVEKDAKRGRVVTFGPDRLSAGPDIFQSHEIILVEGRADIVNLLKMNIENTIAIDGTKISSTIKNICKNRNVIALLDGDRGGDMILKELLLVASIDYIARAPPRKEVEDLSLEDVNFALKNKLTLEHAKFITEKLSVNEFLAEQGKMGKQTFRRQDNSKSKKMENDRDRPKQKQTHSDNKSHQSVESPSNKKEKYPQTHRRGSHHADGDRPTRPSQRKGSFRPRDRNQTRDRDYNRKKSQKFTKVSVPQALISIIKGMRQTFNAVFLNSSHKPVLTVNTADAYEQLKTLNDVNSIIIDGIISQRLLDIAHEKSVKLIVGAMTGELTNRYTHPKITTFNRL